MPEKPAFRCSITARHALQTFQSLHALAEDKGHANEAAGERLLIKACVTLLAITPSWAISAADARWELAKLAAEKARRLQTAVRRAVH